jgi:hypothetical protein
MADFLNRRAVVRIIVVAACVGSFVECAVPQRGRSPEVAAQPSQLASTIFTDTTVFRRICIEADSGLTPAARRCTPRDQRVRVR